MISWESISIGAGHTAKSFVFSAFLRVSANPIFTPSALKYSPLYATLNCHHFPAPPLAEAYSHGSTTVPKIAIDWILWVADIFSRRRGVRWWPFSPVVAGTHGSAQRPVYRHKNIKSRQNRAFFIWFSSLSQFLEKYCLFHQQSPDYLNTVWWNSSGPEFYEFKWRWKQNKLEIVYIFAQINSLKKHISVRHKSFWLSCFFS